MKHLISRVAKGFLPERILRELVGELRISLKHAISSRSVRRKLVTQTMCRVNIGCGGRPASGWINLDVSSGPRIHFWDCRRGLPFSSGTVSAIYMEHVFEHFDLETEARPFLRECLRCLCAGGVLRIVVPDAGAYLCAYNVGWEPLVSMRPLIQTDGIWRDSWLGARYQTKMQLVNAVFRQGSQHKYAYDKETLALVLSEAGFSRVVPQQYGSSLDADMTPDSEARQSESLYIEAVK